MKVRIIIITLLLGFFSINIYAQNYKLNKHNYDHKFYIKQAGDPHNPIGLGVASLIIPGLGQAISGEVVRGLLFFGSTYAAYGFGLGLVMAGAINLSDNMAMTGLGFIIGAGALNIWSIVDAVRIAKVNNMYYQDKHGNLNSLKIEFNPYVDSTNYFGQMQHSVGLSLKLSF